MRTPRAILAVVLASVGFLATAPNSAIAEQRRVAVLSVEGARNAKLERVLRKMVKEEHVVVSNRVYRKAAKRLRARQLNAEHVAEVAAYLEVDGVLEGTLHPKKNGYKLTLRLRAGSSGRPVKTYVIPVKANRFSDRNADKLRDKLRSEIAGLQVIGGLLEADAGDDFEVADDDGASEDATDEEDYDEEEEDYDEEDYDEEDARAKGRRERRKRVNQDEGFEADNRDDSDEEAPDEEDRDVAAADSDERDWSEGEARGDLRDEAEDVERDPYSRVVGLSVQVGPSFVARNLQFSARASLADQVSEYSTVAAPGLFVAGEVFPLAMLSQDDIAKNNVGIGFRYEEALSFDSAVGDADGNQINLPSARRAYTVDFRYRMLLGERDSSPTVTLGVGYNKREYVVDTTPLDGSGLVIDLPNASYTYFDPRASINWPVSRKLAFGISGAFLVVTDAGDMTTPETYGSATITGSDADLNLRYRLTDRITVSVGAMATAIAFDFNNDGELSANRDMDVNTEDVAGALDLYMGGYLTAGYTY